MPRYLPPSTRRLRTISPPSRYIAHPHRPFRSPRLSARHFKSPFLAINVASSILHAPRVLVYSIQESYKGGYSRWTLVRPSGHNLSSLPFTSLLSCVRLRQPRLWSCSPASLSPSGYRFLASRILTRRLFRCPDTSQTASRALRYHYR